MCVHIRVQQLDSSDEFVLYVRVLSVRSEGTLCTTQPRGQGALAPPGGGAGKGGAAQEG